MNSAKRNGVFQDAAHRILLVSLGTLWSILPVAAIGAPNEALEATSDYAGQIQVSQQGATENRSEPQLAGRISGRIVDPSGVAIAGASVALVPGHGGELKRLTGQDGQFEFADVPAGDFRLTVASAGFEAKLYSGVLHGGESLAVPPMGLTISEVVTEVHVAPVNVEVAQQQIKAEEQQRALGFVPNFFVSYVQNAEPLSRKQKFELAWKSTIDPVNFALTGAIAGVEQAQNDFSGYGQGTEGYAKRYGATFANGAINTFLGSAVFPSLLKQDPRYFYKGTGSKRSRILYAVVNAVICKGDNGRWQPNYSGIMGGLAAGGISNTYYPAKDRNGLGLTFENTLIGIGTTAATNILQEFLIKRLTPSAPKTDPSNNGGKVTNPIAKIWDSIVRDHSDEGYGR
jgi:hypothetical protein